MGSKNLVRWFPKLRKPIENIYRSWATAVSKPFSKSLRVPLQFEILAVYLSLSDSDLKTSEQHFGGGQTVDCQVQFSDSRDPWILRLDRNLVYFMIDRLLGASTIEPSEASERHRVGQLTAIDWRAATYAIQELVSPCIDLWENELSVKDLRTVLQPMDGIKEGNYVSIGFQVALDATNIKHPGEQPWRGQWMMPESFLVSQFGRLLFGCNDPASLTVVLARSMISAGELGQLEVGDIISTEQLASDPVAVECNREVLFRGTPGVFQGTKAIRLVV